MWIGSLPTAYHFILKVSEKLEHIATCRVCAWLIDGFSIGWLDLLTPYSHNSELQAAQRYCWSTHLEVHRCTSTRILNLHKSYRGNGFGTVSLSLKITHEGFFSECNFFLVNILDWIQLLCSEAHIMAGWLLQTRLSTLCCAVEFFFITTLNGPHGKHRLLLSLIV
jgi:hypothetical protein